MAYIEQAPFVFDCKQCHTRCDGISKGLYNFEHDASLSEKYEQLYIDHINDAGKYKAAKTNEPGYPDIEIISPENKVVKYVEIKVQQRTFMSVEKYLPLSGLRPSETVALNLSDLLRYFEIESQTNVPCYIAWFLLNRLCLVSAGSFHLYYQSLSELKRIYKNEGSKRTFKRQSGTGDVVDGIHKGVTVNYHFSLAELKLANLK